MHACAPGAAWSCLRSWRRWPAFDAANISVRQLDTVIRETARIALDTHHNTFVRRRKGHPKGFVPHELDGYLSVLGNGFYQTNQHAEGAYIENDPFNIFEAIVHRLDKARATRIRATTPALAAVQG
jgi:hypothetical protein